MLRELLDNTIKSLNLANTFAFAPVLHFKTKKESCPRCHTKLKVHHTDTRKIYLLDIGQCKAHRSFMYCPDCKGVFPSEDFEKQVPPYANVGYDVMVLTGRLILCEHHTINETVLELKKRNVHISPSQVAYLAQKFVIYLSILHQQSASLLKNHIIEKGGYILHVDGTCDGASPHLLSAIDEVSNFVLANVKVPGESKEQVVPFLKEIKKLCHVLLLWALDGKKHGDGMGFPFDRPHAEFYRRLHLLWEQLGNLQGKGIENKSLFKCVTRN